MAKQHIFLIEDDPFLSEIYATKIEEAGFTISVFDNPVLAIDKVKQEKVDLVLLDIVMPNMDGFEILSIIKSDPKTKGIPVIILSNLGEEENVKKGLSLGAVAYLVKAHYTPTEVVAKVKSVLAGEK